MIFALIILKYIALDIVLKVLEVLHDAFGKKCQEMYEDKTMEKKPQPVPMKVPHDDVRLAKVDPTLSKRLEDTKLVEKVHLTQLLLWLYEIMA